MRAATNLSTLGMCPNHDLPAEGMDPRGQVTQADPPAARKKDQEGGNERKGGEGGQRHCDSWGWVSILSCQGGGQLL